MAVVDVVALKDLALAVAAVAVLAHTVATVAPEGQTSAVAVAVETVTQATMVAQAVLVW